MIPTYNRVDMVRDAIDSALAQTHRPEVVVVDDGSTDGTADFVRLRYAHEVRLLARENAERGAARNAGAAATDADVLIFLDADDRIRPRHVETVLSLARDYPGASLWATCGVEVDRELKPMRPLVRLDPGPISLEAFVGGEQMVLLPFGVHAETFRAVGGFVEERPLMGSEDWLLTARLLARADGMRSDRLTVEKRTHDENTMSASSGMERAMRATRERLFGRYREEVARRVEDVEALEARARYAMWRNLAATHYGAGAMRDARRAARAATDGSLARILADPDLRRSWLRSWLGAGVTQTLRGLRDRP